MRRRVALVLLLLLPGLPVRGKIKGVEPWHYPSIRNKTFIQACLDTHNKQRADASPPATNMLYMTWDVALARTARAWANKCIFQHNKYHGHPDKNLAPTGENLYISNARRKEFDPVGAIGAWHKEINSYNYWNHTCTHVCGHYTQIVWDTTYKLGCAIVFCPIFEKKKNIENFVCNYGPGGNYPRKPYTTGKPCSACPEGDTCENNLCRNAKRDRDNSKRYSRWYPPFESRIVCDESCIAVAILRPLLLFFAFGFVCYLKCQYPNMNLQN